MKFSSHRVSPAIELVGIRSLQQPGRDLCPPKTVTVLYPLQLDARRYLNSFRGEPAITRLD
jgi:hypothetical protein